MEKKSNLRPKNYFCIICFYFVQSEKKSYFVIFGWNLKQKNPKKLLSSQNYNFLSKIIHEIVKIIIFFLA